MELLNSFRNWLNHAGKDIGGDTVRYIEYPYAGFLAIQLAGSF